MNQAPADASLIPLFKWGIEQGALVVLLLVIGYFYRKDFQHKVSNSESQVVLLTGVIKQQNEFSSQLLERQAKLTEQSIAVHSQVSAVLTEQSASVKLLIHEIIESGGFSKGPRKNSGNS